MPIIVGVKFANSGKVYYFGPKGIEFNVGDGVIVETIRGQEYAFISQKNTEVPEEEIKNPLKDVIRKAHHKDRRLGHRHGSRGRRGGRQCGLLRHPGATARMQRVLHGNISQTMNDNTKKIKLRTKRL